MPLAVQGLSCVQLHLWEKAFELAAGDSHFEFCPWDLKETGHTWRPGLRAEGASSFPTSSPSSLCGLGPFTVLPPSVWGRGLG